MIVKVRVILNSNKCEIVSRVGSVIKVRVVGDSYENKTNAIIKKLIANYFGVKPNKVCLRKGESGKEKVIEIEGKPEHELRQVLEAIP